MVPIVMLSVAVHAITRAPRTANLGTENGPTVSGPQLAYEVATAIPSPQLSRARWRWPGRRRARLGPQLAEDGFDVVVNSPHRDDEAVSDLAVLQALVQ